MATWTDEQKDALVEQYLAAEPNAENSMEIVEEIAKQGGHSPNGVRMILSKKGVYVTKTPTKKTATSGATGDKAPRVSKEGAQAALVAAITDAGGEADSEIISKLTGKAAQYFTGVIAKINAGDEE
jgi:hypothetical protein